MPPNDFHFPPSDRFLSFYFQTYFSKKEKKKRRVERLRKTGEDYNTRPRERSVSRQIFVDGVSSKAKWNVERERHTRGHREEKEKKGEEGERNERTFNISDRPGWPRGRVFVKTLLAKSGRACVGNGINLSMRTVHPFNIHHAFITAEAIRRLFSRHAVFSSLLSRASSFGPRRPSFLSIGDFRWGWCCCRCCFRCCRPTSVSSTLHTRGRTSERIFTRSRDTRPMTNF